MSNKTTEFLFTLEEISRLADSLSGLILVFELAVEQEMDSSRGRAFYIRSDKGIELAQQCKALFHSYENYINDTKQSP